MKKLFLASSFADVAEHFKDFIGQETESKTVTFIPTASIVEKMNFYVKADRKALEGLGLILDDLAKVIFHKVFSSKTKSILPIRKITGINFCYVGMCLC